MFCATSFRDIFICRRKQKHEKTKITTQTFVGFVVAFSSTLHCWWFPFVLLFCVCVHIRISPLITAFALPCQKEKDFMIYRKKNRKRIELRNWTIKLPPKQNKTYSQIIYHSVNVYPKKRVRPVCGLTCAIYFWGVHTYSLKIIWFIYFDEKRHWFLLWIFTDAYVVHYQSYQLHLTVAACVKVSSPMFQSINDFSFRCQATVKCSKIKKCDLEFANSYSMKGNDAVACGALIFETRVCHLYRLLDGDGWPIMVWLLHFCNAQWIRCDSHRKLSITK